MAAKKKPASEPGEGKIVVAFALRDHSEGEGEHAVTFIEGQRLELSQDDFDDLANRGICAKGVFVKMKTAVEGGRFSLKPHDTTWLAPHVYEAWKAAGYCEPTDDDPEMVSILKAREGALSEVTSDRDKLSKALAEARDGVDELRLAMAAAGAQVELVLGILDKIFDPEDETMEELKEELGKLAEMLPEQIDGARGVADPQLKLD